MQRLSESDAPALQELCDACADYYTLVYGAPATANEARTLLSELPPGKTLTDKYMFGIADRTPELLGVVDMVRGYREAGEWYLGLLLLKPWARKHGRGTAIVEEVIGWLKNEGCKRLRLAVAEQNAAALRFWERRGFVVQMRFPPRQMTARQTVLLELAREL